MVNPKDEGHPTPPELRRRAEARAGGMAPGEANAQEPVDPAEWRRTLQELRVHQIELEMQNDELRQSQEDLDRARASYFELYDLAPVGYCTLSRAGLILETNLAMVTMLGVPRGELLKQPITRFVHREDQDVYYLHRKRFYETGNPQACEMRMAKPDGEVFWGFLMATHIRKDSSGPEDAASDAPRSRLVLTDITWRKQAEEKNAKLEVELHQAQELKTLGVLAGGVAHVINNLLTTILGNANLGTLAVDPAGKVAPYFTAIEKASQRAADLTSQLLAYAGKGKVWVTEVDLNRVVQETLQGLSPSLPAQVTLCCERADRLPFVKGDASQMAQIVSNLMSNAFESFGKDLKGQVTIRTRAEAVDDLTIASGCWSMPIPPGRYATVEVIDSGAGMSPEVQARAFEPFFTTNFAGRGLGLAAVMGILCSHQGGMTVHSEVGRGSSFKVYLPAMQEARSPQAPADPAPWRGDGQLLVADGDPATRSTVRHMAERLGYSVMEAGGGQDAVALFRLRHADLAMVLLDLAMPRMGAPEAFQEMREIDRGVPVVLSSGFDAPDPGVLPEGLAGTIRKPYRFAEFQGLLQRTLA